MIGILSTFLIVCLLALVAWVLLNCRLDQQREARRREREANRLAESLCQINGFEGFDATGRHLEIFGRITISLSDLAAAVPHSAASADGRYAVASAGADSSSLSGSAPAPTSEHCAYHCAYCRVARYQHWITTGEDLECQC